MQRNKQIGGSLAPKAPSAFLICALIFLLLSISSPLNVANLILALSIGALSAVLLLAYWHGKGGIYFILGLAAPMLSILFSDLPDFWALGWVINGFFCGFAILLWLFQLKNSQG
ncbi:hypothetical protein [Pseudoalteromonas luteoviolacea]|uniref:Uncharacterized protein n=1 Tax=Pseudoalteromonas luteoviolacea S4054 TaxID=1129367 RepID=A0A0F6AEL1_9GAMM|nr:hypothetical protein [Pseudoalteromonas luteoviolacea]AOT07551.1 hypothetical protein S4054249_06705 [Pseudoalteromonas luteoviolacea]AOT12467.1 hypothetical protein S40542_06705 [Pseudoalteromonas luteoviolacea]AOT17381.1 hypothetical protein S4054_06705 [Pseudoalteromonas luteoviolacea]KKE84635.1 hypothetical protein N479_07965 [Pseudoalteromonas luteoviolacea S4054]KZN74265.1 hypothetical protein N481_09800 [Pseudoalteromonas luteoviolacea S4047-1]